MEHLARKQLRLACQDGNLQRVQELHRQGVSLTAATNNCGQPIHFAALYGHLDIVQWLHGQGVSLTAATNDGRQPIHFAAAGGHLDIVQWLHGQGASLTAAENDGAQPIHYAALRGHLDIVQWLDVQGVSLTAADNTGWQPIHSAACGGHLDIVQWLHGQGVDVTVATAAGDTPAAVARRSGHNDVADWLDGVLNAPQPQPQPPRPPQLRSTISIGHKVVEGGGRRLAFTLPLSEMTKGVAVAGEQGSGKTVGLKTIIEQLLGSACSVQHVVTLDIAGELGQIGAPQANPSQKAREFGERVYTIHKTFSAGAGQASTLNPFGVTEQLSALPFDTEAEKQIFRRNAHTFVEQLVAPIIGVAPTGGLTLLDQNFPSVRGSRTAFGGVTNDTKATIANAVVEAVEGVLLKYKEATAAAAAPAAGAAATGDVPTTMAGLSAELRCATEPRLASGTVAGAFMLNPAIDQADLTYLARRLEYNMQPTGPFGPLFAAPTAEDCTDNPGPDDVYALNPKALFRAPVHEVKKHSIISLANLTEKQRTLAVMQLIQALARELPATAGRLASTQHAPKIAIVLDEVGALCPYNPSTAKREGETGAAAYIAHFLNLCRKYGIIVLLSAQCVGQLHPVVRKAIGGPVCLGYPGGRTTWEQFVDTRFGKDGNGKNSRKREIIGAVKGLERSKHQFVLLPEDKTKAPEVVAFKLPIHQHQDAGVFGPDVTDDNRDKHPIARTDEERQAKRARSGAAGPSGS